MQLRTVLAGLATLLLGTRAEAWVDMWNEGTPVQTGAQCGGATPGLVSRAGYSIDPYQGLPLVGYPFYARATAVNQNCTPDYVTMELRLPAGASLAITSWDKVKCVVRTGSTETELAGCAQAPSLGPNGGLMFTAPALSLSAGTTLEVRVPIKLAQAASVPFDVITTSIWGTRIASVEVTAPYQPPVPTGTRGDDLVVVGSDQTDAGTLPTAFSNDNGAFTATNYAVGDFHAWARTPGVTRLSGDFDRNGLMDIALVGGPGWNTIPVALARGDGKYTIMNTYVGAFGAWASTPGVKPVAGDFNRDGHTDIALVGGPYWTSIPIAFSARGGGNGYFEIANQVVYGIPSWAHMPGARPIVADFNRDGMDDIALVGGAGWTTLPVAYSLGDGRFNVANPDVTGTGWNFAQTVSAAGSKLIVADFNHDGMADLLVLGTASMTLRYAESYGNGTWKVYERIGGIGIYAARPNAKVVTGDFNHDGWPDLAVTIQDNVNGYGIALNIGNGHYSERTFSTGNFGNLAATPGVRLVAGDFNGDGFSDIALVGGADWASIPMAIYDPYLLWHRFVNVTTKRFPKWASDPTASVFVGKANY